MSLHSIKLNLGCGKQYLTDYINCDLVKSVKADKVFDLNTFLYPFEDNYADEILMDNVLEHLNDIVKVMEELYRLLKPNGIAKIYVPYAKSDGALQDPTHIHFFTEKSMNYFATTSDYNYYSSARFLVKRNDLRIGGNSIITRCRKLIPFKQILKKYLLNIYDGIYFELQAIKS